MPDYEIEELTNEISIAGAVVSAGYSHSVMHRFGKTEREEKFYKFDIAVPRRSDTEDVLPVVISERFLDDVGQPSDLIGKSVQVNGDIRTYRAYDPATDRRLVNVYIFAPWGYRILSDENEVSIEENNAVMLKGRVVREPKFRETRTGRLITDLMISSNRRFRRGDTIPIVCWGPDAKVAKNFKLGDLVSIDGRFQSRTFQSSKMDSPRTVYEVSAVNVRLEENSPASKNDERPEDNADREQSA